MLGADSYNEALFSTIRLEEFVPANHPLRPIRTAQRRPDQNGCQILGNV